MFGQKLRELRLHGHYSMDELAELYNNKYNGRMNKSTISRYENNLQEPMVSVVKNLADLFGVSLDSLTGSDEKPTPENEDGLSAEILKLLESLSKADREIVLSLAHQMKQRETESQE